MSFSNIRIYFNGGLENGVFRLCGGCFGVAVGLRTAWSQENEAALSAHSDRRGLHAAWSIILCSISSLQADRVCPYL